MATYFFDKQQRITKIVTDRRTLSSMQTQELTDGLLLDYLTVSIPNEENLSDSEYMAVRSHEGNSQSFDMYRITNVETKNEATTFTGIQIAYYELAGHVLEDVRPTNREVSYVANQIVSGTEWRVGYVAPSLKKVTTTFYYLSAKDAFSKLQEVADCEVLFKVEISGTGITDKWVEIYERLGNKTMKRFNYGSNALTVEREVGKNDIYTALIGLGRGEEVGEGYGRKIDFSEIEWKETAGNPIDKPLGQKYIELPEYTSQFGIKTETGMKARVGIVEFSDVEDKQVLIQSTYETLLETSRPKVQFKATVLNIGKTNIGDTVTIHRHDLGIHYQTRVFKVVRDKLDDDRTQVELGDAISQSSVKKQAQVNKVVGSLQDRIEKEINYVVSTADGKNSITYGNAEPTQKRVGDLWFRDHPSLVGERQMLIWDGNAWVIQLDTSETSMIEREVEQAQATADQAKQDALNSYQNALEDAQNYTDDQLLALGQITDISDVVASFERKIAGAITDANGYTDVKATEFDARAGVIEEEVATVKQSANEALAGVDTAITQAGLASAVASQASSQAGASLVEAGKASRDANTALTNAVLALNNYEKLDKRNLYVEATEHEGRVINSDGSFSENAFYNTSDYIRVYAGETYTFQDYSGELDLFRVASYDAYTSGFIKRVGVGKDSGTYVVPEGVSHIRVSRSSKGPSKIERGDTKSDYTQAPEDVQISITNIKGELEQKVSQTSFNVLNGTVQTQSTSILQNKNDIALKASQSFVDTISGKVDTNASEILLNKNAIKLKASQSSVDTVSEKVNANTSQILINTTSIQSKVSSTDVENILTGKQYVNETELTQTAKGFTASITQLSSKVDSLDARNLYVDATESVGRVLNATGGTDASSFYSTSHYIRVYAGETYTFQDYGGVLDSFRVSQYDLNTSTDFKRRVGVSVNNGKLVIPSDVTHIRVSKQAGSKVKIERSEVLSEWTPAPEDVTTLDKFTTIVATIDGIQSTVSNKAEQSQVTQLSNALQSRVTNEQMESRFTQTANTINLRINSLDKRNGYVNATESVDFVLSANGSLTPFVGYSTSDYIRVYAGETVSLKDYSEKLDLFRVGLYDLSVGTNFIERISISKAVGKFIVPEGVTHIRVSRSKNGMIKVENNDTWTDWTPAPEDVADKSTLVSQINLSESGVLIQGKNIQLDGNVTMTAAFVTTLKAKSIEAVYADIASIKTKILTADVIDATMLKASEAMVGKLFANEASVKKLTTMTAFIGEITAISLTAVYADITNLKAKVLTANVIDSTHLKADNALINKLFATTALIDTLTSKTAFINNIKAIDISADNITTGTLNAAEVNIINLNVSSLVGNKSVFVQSAWNGLDTTTSITSSGLITQLGDLSTKLTGGEVKTISGTKTGKVNALGMEIYDSSNGQTTRLYSDGLEFNWYGIKRVVEQNSEGLTIRPISGSANRLNSSLHLVTGAGSDKVAYVDLQNPSSGKGARFILQGSDVGIRHPSGGVVQISDFETNDGRKGNLRAGTFQTSTYDGRGLRIVETQINTLADNQTIFIIPSGTGELRIGSGGSSPELWPVRASRFVEGSSRASKTDIVPYTKSALEEIRSLQAVNFRRKEDVSNGYDYISLGFIAEDSPSISIQQSGNPAGVDHYKMVTLAIKSSQELDLRTQKQANELQETNTFVTQHELEIQNLKKRIEQLEERVA